MMRWWWNTRPGRTLARYLESRGALLARGMSFSAVFSVLAAVYVFFAVFGIVFESSKALRDAVVEGVSATIPGLIDTGAGGAIDVDALFDVQVLGISGLLAMLALVFTASGWLRSFRDGVRTIFGLPEKDRAFLLMRLIDVALVIALGVLMVFSAALSVIVTQALGLADKWMVSMGYQMSDSFLVVAGLLLALLIDVLVFFMLFRLQSRIPVSNRVVLRGAFMGAIGFGVLKYLGAELASGASNNPLMAGFAVILGLMVWFKLVMQWLLLTTAWIAVGPRSDRQ
ncbi:MAG: YihY/virulence factor BrkB family protein [Xanthomonadales bacterium]|nr:YihY/virulence factor BrkB family protein [Xanthomonadales bacterium]MCA0197001.1 YihY/virulence factor BrkB family protein [Pseudomonadota bacterium]HRF84219.1 YihY/virulence factor BrkB family protein [Pseudoxanthomonas sp.]